MRDLPDTYKCPSPRTAGPRVRACIYIRQTSRAHVISDIIPLSALYKSLPKCEGNCSAVIAI